MVGCDALVNCSGRSTVAGPAGIFVEDGVMYAVMSPKPGLLEVNAFDLEGLNPSLASPRTADIDSRITMRGRCRMTLSKFGPFAVAFSRGELSVPRHLELLGFARKSAQIVIDSGRGRFVGRRPASLDCRAIRRSELATSPGGSDSANLDDGALLEPGLLWQAMDAGSWSYRSWW